MNPSGTARFLANLWLSFLLLLCLGVHASPADASLAYVANREGGSVSIVDTATHVVVDSFPVTQPFGIAFTPNGSRAYVTSIYGDAQNVVAVDTATKATVPIPVGGNPSGVVVSLDGSKVYVTRNGAFEVAVISTADNSVKFVNVGTNPQGVALSPDGSRLYIAVQSSGTVVVMETATDAILATIPVSGFPSALAVTPDGSRLYVPRPEGSDVAVINTATNTVIDHIPTGARSFGVAITPDGARAYVGNYADNTVSVINLATNKVIDTISLPGPALMAASADGTEVLVTLQDAGQLAIIRTSDNTAIRVVTGTLPQGVAIKPGPSPIAAPDGLTARIYAPRQVELHWNDRSTNETGYKVYRRVAGETTFLLAATLGKNVQLYREGPMGFRTYEYLVRAVLNTTVSAPSNIASVKIPALPAPPADVTVTVEATAPGLTVNWTDKQESTADRYEVWRRSGGAGAFTLRTQLPADNTQTVNYYSYVEPVNSIAPNTVYSYYVRALNASGSNDSATKTVTSSGPPAAALDLTAKAPPQGGLITLSWRDVGTNEYGFHIWRSAPGEAFVEYDSVAANTTQFVDLHTAYGKTYRYYLIAYNGWGASGPSNIATVTVPTSPPIPTGLTAKAAPLALRIDLTWNDTTTETGYEVWRKNGPANNPGDYSRLAYLPANATSYQDLGNLTAGATYTYFLIAYNEAGPANPSSTATATLDGVPDAPQGVTAKASPLALRVEVAWQDTTKETGYEVWRKQGTGAYARRAVLRADVKSYADTTEFVAGATYTYYVVAFNPLGSSAPSSLATATLDATPTAPQGFTASPVRNKKRVLLQWQDSAAEQSYEIWRKPGSLAQAGTYTRLTTVAAGTLRYVDTQVQWKKRYSYYVVAVNPLGSIPSNKDDAKVSKKP